MAGVAKKLYSPLFFDCLFAGAGIAGAIGLAVDVGRAYPAIGAAGDWSKPAALLGSILAASLLASITSTFDQNRADEFVFRTLSKSALIAMFTTIFALAIWQLFFLAKFGGISSYAMIGVMVASWSIAYFFTRLRGTSA